MCFWYTVCLITNLNVSINFKKNNQKKKNSPNTVQWVPSTCEVNFDFKNSTDLMITLSQFVGMSAIANYIDPFQDYSHSDDQNTLSTVTSRFKPFTAFFKTFFLCNLSMYVCGFKFNV